ncbi:hypothetical protein MTER_35400 [Mycolicibacter terrae]|uniref:Transmembrane protein n=1 Tax=Mycolicibacter terrae TaxID=1788 RepID=A0AAD1HZA4_9MYCO|nr:hypothetical protein [Mycolicibacter terrae]ORW93734.1 hypothetical protein AWC28_16875 [Mycolicibacter terrae]BBX24129.1 hypothetical protein MTER_35400 [Mycolicibacter terrae]SNV56166.1 Uncharacterised protein [Mycolicibacter terrae]
MTGPEIASQSPAATRPARPADVDTGFWLWLAALPLMTTGYVVGLLASPEIAELPVTYPMVGLTALVVVVVVATFLMLMRSGYRWARTGLTGGGIASVVYAVSGLSHADARPAVAVTVAVTGIVGSVLIAAGTYLLHRADAQEYFTR